MAREEPQVAAESKDDTVRVFRLLAEAEDEYREYLRLTSLGAALQPPPEPDEPERNWDFPLGLVLGEGR